MLLPDAIHKFVRVYPLAEWNRQEALLVGDNDFNALHATVRRLALSDCTDCEVDKLGRVLIPASVRSAATLERDVLWVGVGKSIELWDRKRFQDMRNEWLNNPEKLQAVSDHMAALRPR